MEGTLEAYRHLKEQGWATPENQPIISTDWVSKMTQFSRDLEIRDLHYGYTQLYDTIDVFLREEFDELEEAAYEIDDVEILDGAGDVAFIALNLIYKLGVIKGLTHKGATNLVNKVMLEISNSNLSKLLPDGSVIRDEATGKVQKPDTFKEPNLKSILENLGE
jgi:hypothetical protein